MQQTTPNLPVTLGMIFDAHQQASGAALPWHDRLMRNLAGVWSAAKEYLTQGIFGDKDNNSIPRWIVIPSQLAITAAFGVRAYLQSPTSATMEKELFTRAVTSGFLLALGSIGLLRPSCRESIRNAFEDGRSQWDTNHRPSLSATTHSQWTSPVPSLPPAQAPQPPVAAPKPRARRPRAAKIDPATGQPVAPKPRKPRKRKTDPENETQPFVNPDDLNRVAHLQRWMQKRNDGK